jgi:archaellin
MNNEAKLGTIAGILLLGFILIGAVSASIIVTDSTNLSEDDLNTITNEVVDEICSYLQIKHIIGDYQIIQGEQKIQQIAILIKPLVSQEINVSHIIIELNNGNQFTLLYFNGNADTIHNYTVFDHPLWNSVTPSTFSVLPTIDDDNSIITTHYFNKNTDMAFILLKLPDTMAMKYDSQLRITLITSPGQSRTVTVESPLPIHNIVTLYE